MSEVDTMPVMLPPAMSGYNPVESVQISENPADIPAIETKEPESLIVSRILMSPVQYQEITKNMVSLITEVRLFLSPEGIESRFVDTANVAMIQYQYKGSGFEMFKTAGTHEIGIDVSEWRKFSKMVKKGNPVLFELTRTEKEQSPADKERDIHSYNYRYSLSCNGNVQSIDTLDINTIRKNPNMPEVELPTKINVYAADLIETINSAKAISDKIVFISDEKGFSAVSTGDRSILNKLISITGRTGPGFRSVFSIDYLADYVKAIQNKKEIVTLHFRTDYLMKIEFSDDTREIVFLLAPRIETKD